MGDHLDAGQTLDRRSHAAQATVVEPSLSAPGPNGRLTAREREVALLIATGLKNVVIGRMLGISASTVETYVQRIQARLQVGSRREIAAWAAARATTRGSKIQPF
jgi:DNA-binding NarL/FixJ family response regulator